MPIFKGKGDVMNCGSCRGVKLLKHGMKIIERVLERRIRALVDFNKVQFGFVPGKGITDALYLVRRFQEHRAKDKRMYMCFVDLEKANAGHRKFTLYSATAKYQWVVRNRKFAVIFCTSATANDFLLPQT